VAVLAREGRVARHAQQRREQALLDAERRKLAELVEQRAALGHQLTDERECVLWLLAHEGAEPRSAEEECLALLVGAGVGDVLGGGGQPLRPERLAGGRDPGDETPAGANPAA
jgi:hypothetical protein